MWYTTLIIAKDATEQQYIMSEFPYIQRTGKNTEKKEKRNTKARTKEKKKHENKDKKKENKTD